MNCELVVKNIRTALKEYVVKNNLNSLVVGVSGGIDSALVCALSRPVCDELGIKLIGRSLPIETNKQDEIDRAIMVGESFCHDFLTDYSLENVYDAFHVALDAVVIQDSKSEKIRCGNIKARLRMIYLYNLAYVNKGLVLSTDNLTEYYLSFWTQHGDVGDYAMLQHLWKTEVYEISRWITDNELYCLKTKDQEKIIALECCVICTPTDGLGITSSDLEQLGANTYDEVDIILKTWLTKDQDNFCWDTCFKYEGRTEDYNEFVKIRESYKDHAVVQRHINSQFKRDVPIIVSRSSLFQE